MTAPLTYPEAAERGLVSDAGAGIHTFSNGSDWRDWADTNCMKCQYYDPDGTAGESCAFECAAFLHDVSPKLAALFGWMQDAESVNPDDDRDGWEPPAVCPYFSKRAPVAAPVTP